MDGAGFGWALNQLKAGREVKRTSWAENVKICLIIDVEKNTQKFSLQIFDDDLLAEDWVSAGPRLVEKAPGDLSW